MNQSRVDGTRLTTKKRMKKEWNKQMWDLLQEKREEKERTCSAGSVVYEGEKEGEGTKNKKRARLDEG